MKINRKKLADAVAIMAEAAKKQQRIDTAAIEIEADGGVVSLRYVGGISMITKDLECDGGDVRKCIVDLGVLAKALKTLRGEFVEVEANNSVMTVESEAARVSLTLLTDSPDPFESDESYFMTRELTRGIEFASHAASGVESRYAMTGVNIMVGPCGSWRAVATDGKRLAVAERLEAEEWRDVELKSAALPIEMAKSVVKLFSDDAVEIGVGKRTISFGQKDTNLVARASQGIFPPWEKTIPTDRCIEIYGGARGIMTALKTTRSVMGGEKRAVVLSSEGKTLTIASHDYGEVAPNAAATARAELISADGDIKRSGYCVDYLIDAIGAFGVDSTVKIEWRGKKAPLIFREVPIDKVKSKRLAVVMPINLGEDE